MTERSHTVLSLKLALEGIPENASVKLEDADTNWTIPKFSISYNAADNILWFYPCSYQDMEG